MDAITEIRQKTLHFIGQHRFPGGKPWEYRYSLTATRPTLYSSTYAVMTRSLYNDLGSLSEEERRAWIDYFNNHQDDDGLFRDPIIFNQGWYQNDPFWCGRPHLTCHVLTALSCLSGKPGKPFRLVDNFARPNILGKWLQSRNWNKDIGISGNEILNLGAILQYSRDLQGDQRAEKSVRMLLNWLGNNHLNPQTGVWGTFDISDPVKRSNAVQTAYHLWLLYFYDRVPIPCPEKAIDTILATQNPKGGFGWGVHNPAQPFNSSACEDIDSIDPLSRLYHLTDYRRKDIFSVLNKALPRILQNQTPDGGFVFFLNRAFQYGHPELKGEINAGAMFPTWFRTLSVALMEKVLADNQTDHYPWYFTKCPNCQFWLPPMKGGKNETDQP